MPKRKGAQKYSGTKSASSKPETAKPEQAQADGEAENKKQQPQGGDGKTGGKNGGGKAPEKEAPFRNETPDGVQMNGTAFNEDLAAGKVKQKRVEFTPDEAKANLEWLLKRRDTPPDSVTKDPKTGKEGIMSRQWVTADGEKPVLGPAGDKFAPEGYYAEPLTDKSKLSDVSDVYVDAIRNSKSFQDALAVLKKEYDRPFVEPWQSSVSLPEPPAVLPKPDYEAIKAIHDNYYASYEARLTALHMNGGYDKQADAKAGTHDIRMSAREELVKADPSKYELDCMMVNQTRHGMNFEAQLNARGGDFYNTTFKTKGDPPQELPKPGSDATEAEWKRYADAVVDLYDRGLLEQPVGPDGKTMTDFAVEDEYTKNYDKYQEKAAEINAYRCEVEKLTVDKCREQAESADPNSNPVLAGQKITAVTSKQYADDVAAYAADMHACYADRDYSSGKDPHLDYFAGKNVDMSFAKPGPTHGGLQDGNVVTLKAPEVVPEQTAKLAENVGSVVNQLENALQK